MISSLVRHHCLIVVRQAKSKEKKGEKKVNLAPSQGSIKIYCHLIGFRRASSGRSVLRRGESEGWLTRNKNLQNCLRKKKNSVRASRGGKFIKCLARREGVWPDYYEESLLNFYSFRHYKFSHRRPCMLDKGGSIVCVRKSYRIILLFF
jgi:hypothetical protein